MKEIVDPFGIDVKTLTEIVDKQIRFSFTSGYLNLLKRHGFEREDIIQSVLEQLIHDKDGYDPEKGEVATFVATVTASKLYRMTRDAMNYKRKAQHMSVTVSLHADTPQELIEVFGKSPDHAGQLRSDHVRQTLLETYPAKWVDLFLEYTIGDYSLREMTLRHPDYNYNGLQRKFTEMRKTARQAFQET